MLPRIFKLLFSILKKLMHRDNKPINEVILRESTSTTNTDYNKLLALYLACFAFDTYNIRNLDQLKKKYGKLAIAFFDKNNIEGFIIRTPKFFSKNISDGIIVSIRGTDEIVDWLRNLNAYKKKISWTKHYGNLEAHRGFVNGYNSVRKEILKTINKFDHSNIYITGHSLGGAIATLCALDLKILQNQRIQASGNKMVINYLKTITMYNFGCPRVGDNEFATYYNHEISYSHRIMTRGDPVTLVPPSLNGKYKHVQKGLYLKTTNKELVGILKDLAKSIKNGAHWFGIIASVKALIKNHLAYIPALKEENGIKGKYNWFGTDY